MLYSRRSQMPLQLFFQHFCSKKPEKMLESGVFRLFFQLFCHKTWRKCWNQVFSNFSSNFFAQKVGTDLAWYPRQGFSAAYREQLPRQGFLRVDSAVRFCKNTTTAEGFSGSLRKVFPWLPRKKNYSASAFIASVRTFISVSKSLRARHSLAWWHWSSCQGVWTPKAIVPGMCLAYVPPPIAIGSVNCSR